MSGTYFKQAAIAWIGIPFQTFLGRVGYEASDGEYTTVDRVDHVAADGQKVSYFIGERRFIIRSFRYQSDSALASFLSFFRTHGGQGKEFVYHEDAPPLCGLSYAGYASTSLICGGSVSAGIPVTLEDLEFRPTREEIDGYWQWVVTMRRKV